MHLTLFIGAQVNLFIVQSVQLNLFEEVKRFLP